MLRSARSGHIHGPGGYTHGPSALTLGPAGHTHGDDDDGTSADSIAALVGAGPVSGRLSVLTSSPTFGQRA